MVIAEIMTLTGASKPSVYRWMEKHPTLTMADPDSLLGHPFPKPVRKEGRTVHWDDDQVQQWWEANGTTVGRHPEDSPTIVMSWESFRRAMQIAPKLTPEDGVEVAHDHMDMVQQFQRRDDEVKLWFRNVSDAVLFKLTYS